MKRYILALVCLTVTIGLFAQERIPQTITFKTGDRVTFSQDKIDSARVVFGPGGGNDSLGIKIYSKDGTVVDYLYSQIEQVVFFSQVTPSDPANSNRNDISRNRYGWRLEFPKFHEGDEATTYEITHYTTDGYGVNFSLEWDGKKRANRWTCYQMIRDNHKETPTAERKSSFIVDPDITDPACQSRPDEYEDVGPDGKKIFDRGHICPSEDRVYRSQEQNDQTFYMSNMQPQYYGHNRGEWSQLERKVRTLAMKSDTLYVVKAATIDEGNIEDHRTVSGLVIPKFFYIALLAYNVETKEYHALGIWSPHLAKGSGKVREYLTIEELQRRTNIDFFCNLPDEVERQVEADATPENHAYWELEPEKPIISGHE
ncbi:MAG: DNA/RNA non-specific endonuclease [Prevotella sp.]|nr:DNA/RNA non-specific endonuclease [Prevotella sp.]